MKIIINPPELIMLLEQYERMRKEQDKELIKKEMSIRIVNKLIERENEK